MVQRGDRAELQEQITIWLQIFTYKFLLPQIRTRVQHLKRAHPNRKRDRWGQTMVRFVRRWAMFELNSKKCKHY